MITGVGSGAGTGGTVAAEQSVLYNRLMSEEKEFYKNKTLEEMTPEEWEMLCDGCGKCCYNKYITGRGKNTRLYYTSVSCNFLDVGTGRCMDYENRFRNNRNCLKLSLRNLKEFTWLPETCAYRLIYEGKNLPDWHPLISGIPVAENPAAREYLIKNGIRESEAEYWEDHVINCCRLTDLQQ